MYSLPSIILLYLATFFTPKVFLHDYIYIYIYICYRCTENERKRTLLASQKELEMQTNEGRRLLTQVEKEQRITLQQKHQYEQEETEKRRSHEMEIKRKDVELEKESNEGKRLAIQQEEEKSTTMRQQLQHDSEESEKRRLHEIEIKKHDATMAAKKVKAEKDLKKFELQERQKSALIQQQENHRHAADMQDRLNEAKRLDLQIIERQAERDKYLYQLQIEKDKHQLQNEKERHRHKEAMQEYRIEEKAIELQTLQMKFLLKHGPGKLQFYNIL